MGIQKVPEDISMMKDNGRNTTHRKMLTYISKSPSSDSLPFLSVQMNQKSEIVELLSCWLKSLIIDLCGCVKGVKVMCSRLLRNQHNDDPAKSKERRAPRRRGTCAQGLFRSSTLQCPQRIQQT